MIRHWKTLPLRWWPDVRGSIFRTFEVFVRRVGFVPMMRAASRHQISYPTAALLIDLVLYVERRWRACFLQDSLWINVDEIPLSTPPKSNCKFYDVFHVR